MHYAWVGFEEKLAAKSASIIKCKSKWENTIKHVLGKFLLNWDLVKDLRDFLLF